MAVPSAPTVDSVVTQALKRAGRTTPTAAQIQEATDHALQEVKADIMLIADTHPNLLATATTTTIRGQQRYPVPLDFNEQETISLLDGPDNWRGVVQAAGGATLTLDPTITYDAEDIVGKYVLITQGIGVEQYREILDYTAGVATVDSSWDTLPVLSDTYLIVGTTKQLYPVSTANELDRVPWETMMGSPIQASLHSQEFILYPVPDKSTYGLMNRYWVDISLLDESGDLFTQLLREWRSVFVQGVAVKSMQRFDEDRYGHELGVYKLMLDLLASETCRVTPMRQFDY